MNNMDTTELGGGSYPTPPEIEMDETNIEIHVTYKTTDIFDKSWDKQEIEDYIKGNLGEYINTSEIDYYEVEVN